MSDWGPEHITLAMIDPNDTHQLVHFAYYTEPSRRQAQTLCGRAFAPSAWRQAGMIPVLPDEQDRLDVQRLPEGTQECPACAERLSADLS